MKIINKSLVSGLMALMLLVGFSLACNQHGNKLEINKGELYYTDKIPEAEAKKFGDYLVKTGLFNGQEKSVQLDKEGSTYQVKMVIKPELHNDEDYIGKLRAYGKEMAADFFNNAPLEIHICDDSLKTVRVVKI